MNFGRIKDALAYMRATKPPAGMRWVYEMEGPGVLETDEDELDDATVRVYAEEQWPVDEYDIKTFEPPNP